MKEVCVVKKVSVNRIVFVRHTKGLEKNEFFSAFIWADFLEKISWKMGNFSVQKILPTKPAHNRIMSLTEMSDTVT